MGFFWFNGFAFESTFLFLHCVYGILMFFWVCVYGYTEEERCDPPTRAREKLWRDNPFLTITATQSGRGLSYGWSMEIQR